MEKKIKLFVQKVPERFHPGKILDNLPLTRKRRLLYLCCVLLPLILTDSIIFSLVIKAEQSSSQHEMENIAEAIHYTLSNRMDNAANLSLNIYSNKYINEFMDAEYASPLDYYESYRDFLKEMCIRDRYNVKHHHTFLTARFKQAGNRLPLLPPAYSPNSLPCCQENPKKAALAPVIPGQSGIKKDCGVFHPQSLRFGFYSVSRCV